MVGTLKAVRTMREDDFSPPLQRSTLEDCLSVQASAKAGFGSERSRKPKGPKTHLLDVVVGMAMVQGCSG